MKKNWFFGISSRLLMVIVAGLLVLSYLTIVVNPAEAWMVTLLGLLFIPLSIVNLFLVLWAVKRRSRAVLIPLFAFLPAVLFMGRYVQFGEKDEPKDSGVPLKVMSYNVGAFASCDRDSLFAYIKSQDADIICLQEFYVDNISQVRSFLKTHFKEYKAEYFINHQYGKGSGNVTLSRFRAVDKGVINFDESSNLAIYTDYVVQRRKFRVYNCHFQSYGISFNGIVRSWQARGEDVFAETGRKVKKSILLRPKQVDQVMDHIESSPLDAFVCGDFNDNPMSYTYHRLTRGRKDSFIESGKGFGATFSMLWPMLRIDYILFPDRCVGISHDTPRVSYSDHYPVVAELYI